MQKIISYYWKNSKVPKVPSSEFYWVKPSEIRVLLSGPALLLPAEPLPLDHAGAARRDPEASHLRRVPQQLPVAARPHRGRLQLLGGGLRGGERNIELPKWRRAGLKTSLRCEYLRVYIYIYIYIWYIYIYHIIYIYIYIRKEKNARRKTLFRSILAERPAAKSLKLGAETDPRTSQHQTDHAADARNAQKSFWRFIFFYYWKQNHLELWLISFSSFQNINIVLWKVNSRISECWTMNSI